MSIHTDILIVGGGPGGLACATLLARQGKKVILVERSREIGPKVCAGGITWDGLINHVPERLIERSFDSQYIFSNLQKVIVREGNPIIATISRKTLGRWMANTALEAGVEIVTGMQVHAIHGHQVSARTNGGGTKRFTCSHLIGADGSHSLVRRTLDIPVDKVGPGINYQVPGTCNRMEWHLNSRLFGYGYGWIFPHQQTISVGAYCPGGNMRAGELKRRLIKWAGGQGYDLHHRPCRAAMINYDYRGYQFGSTWLVGDAAGLASGLTGEGIYPAIVSGETVARRILNPDCSDQAIKEMVCKQQLHHRVINLSARHQAVAFLLMEFLTLMLKWNRITFHDLEMAPAAQQNEYKR